MPFSFLHNHIHSLLSLSCCQSSYFPHSIKRAIIGKAVAVSLSLVYIYGCPVALGICVCERVLQVCSVFLRDAMSSQFGSMWGFCLLLGAHNSCEVDKKGSSVSTRHSV